MDSFGDECTSSVSASKNVSILKFFIVLAALSFKVFVSNRHLRSLVILTVSGNHRTCLFFQFTLSTLASFEPLPQSDA